MKTKTKKRKPLKSLAHIKKLSTLLALGLRDLRKQERAKNSVVNMGEWLEFNGKCAACLAGSVMRWSLGRLETTYPHDVPDDGTWHRIHALNSLMGGMVRASAAFVGAVTSVPDRLITDYHEDRRAWWSDMRQLLKDLRAAGE